MDKKEYLMRLYELRDTFFEWKYAGNGYWSSKFNKNWDKNFGKLEVVEEAIRRAKEEG